MEILFKKNIRILFSDPNDRIIVQRFDFEIRNSVEILGCGFFFVVL